jgi:hypothetical protein
MVGLGDEWDNATPASVAKMNGMTVTYGTGAYLAALDKTKHKLVVCTSTGSGLTVDHVYLANSTGTTWLDIGGILPHTHSAEDTGGSFKFILLGNPEIIDLDLIKTTDMVTSAWDTVFTGTGSAESATDGSSIRYIKLRPNATSGSGATIRYPGPLNLDFALSSMFICSTQIDTASSLALHAGVNADDVTAADTNTRKYNAEVCTATNLNWFLRSADNAANSTSDTGTAITTNRVGIKILHLMNLGTPEVNMEIDGGTTFQKTSNVPISGSTTTNNLVKFSIKNSTGADRPYRVYGCRIAYTTSSAWGYA